MKLLPCLAKIVSYVFSGAIITIFLMMVIFSFYKYEKPINIAMSRYGVEMHILGKTTHGRFYATIHTFNVKIVNNSNTIKYIHKQTSYFGKFDSGIRDVDVYRLFPGEFVDISVKSDYDKAMLPHIFIKNEYGNIIDVLDLTKMLRYY